LASIPGVTKTHSKKIALQANQIKGMIEKHGLTCTVKITGEPYTAKTVLDYVKKTGIDLLTVIGNTDNGILRNTLRVPLQTIY